MNLQIQAKDLASMKMPTLRVLVANNDLKLCAVLQTTHISFLLRKKLPERSVYGDETQVFRVYGNAL